MSEREPSGYGASGSITPALKQEAFAILTYVFAAEPTSAVTERYMTWLDKQQDQMPKLPVLVVDHPWLIGFFEPVGGGTTQSQVCLRQRLDAALALCEASTSGAALVVGSSPVGRLSSLVIFGLYEVICFPIRLIRSLLRLPR